MAIHACPSGPVTVWTTAYPRNGKATVEFGGGRRSSTCTGGGVDEAVADIPEVEVVRACGLSPAAVPLTACVLDRELWPGDGSPSWPEHPPRNGISKAAIAGKKRLTVDFVKKVFPSSLSARPDRPPVSLRAP